MSEQREREVIEGKRRRIFAFYSSLSRRFVSLRDRAPLGGSGRLRNRRFTPAFYISRDTQESAGQ